MEQPWKTALVEALSDGEWHNYKQIVQDISSSVPPDMGFNKGEYYRQYHYRKKGQEPPKRRYGTDTDTMRTGQRVVLSRTIQNLCHSHVIEIQRTTDPGVRSRPEFIRLLKRSGK